nr:pentapeptide repeat-containing protein [Micromonospora sp. DSM 115978]
MSDWTKRNARALLKEFQRHGLAVGLRISDYHGEDLTGQVFDATDRLAGTDFSGADLTAARFPRGADLTGANLSGCRLVGASLDGADLRGADLRGADLSLGSLVGADLTDADLTGVRWGRTKLTGARLPPAALDDLGWGTARPDDPPRLTTGTAGTSVTDAAWHPAGHLLAVAHGNRVEIWDVGSAGQSTLVLALAGHGGIVRSVAWSPDGIRLATAGDDDTARTWDPEAGTEVAVLTGHYGPVNAVTWSPDGTRLATASADGTVLIWDSTTAAVVATLVGHAGPVTALAWSPDLWCIATGGEDHTVRLWDPTTGTETAILTDHRGTVRSLAWSPDSMWLASADAEKALHFRRRDTGAVAYSRTHSEISSVAWSPDATQLATAHAAGTASLWNIVAPDDDGSKPDVPRTDRPLPVLVVTGPSHWSILQATTNSGKAADPADVEASATLPGSIGSLTGHASNVTSVAWSPGGTQIATTSYDGTARIWDVVSATTVAVLSAPAAGGCAVSWSPDGRRLATTNGAAAVWDLDAATAESFAGDLGAIEAVAWSPDDARIAISGADQVIVSDSATGAVTTVLRSLMAWSLAWSPGGSWLAAAGADTAIRMWESGSGSTFDLTGHDGSIYSMVWSPDGAQLATSSIDETIRIWNLDTRSVTRVLGGHREPLGALAWSPDGGTLATRVGAESVQFWDTATWTRTGQLDSHTGVVLALDWSPDGARLATAGSDGTVRIWAPRDTSGPQDRRFHWPVATVGTPHGGRVSDVAYAPDGRRLALGLDDGSAMIVDLSGDEPRVTRRLIGLPDGGWAVFLDDRTYRLRGDPAGRFWWSAGLCRFEPGELDGVTVTRLPEEPSGRA